MRFRKRHGRTIGAAVLAAAMAVGACGGAETTETTGEGGAPAGSGPAVPEGLFVAAEPVGARDVAEVKAAAKEGDRVVIRGRVGTLEPFVKDRAVMTIVDPALVPCSEMAMEDGCKTPWDYCCTPGQEITQKSATVQVLDEAGRPLRLTLSAGNRVEPLDTVVVEGVVGPRPDPKVLVVNAERIYVKP